MNLNPYDLHRYARKGYSQFGETGIIEHLVERVVPERTFIEIGSGGMSPYIENNTMDLVKSGWTGIWCDPLLAGHKVPPGVKAVPRKVMIEDAELLRVYDHGLLSIDVDGNDYWLWRSMWRGGFGPGPSIVVIEFQAQQPLDVAYVMPYEPLYAWDHRSQDNGASLRSMIDLGSEMGYTFVGTASPTPQLDSPNAFFVRDDLAHRVLA